MACKQNLNATCVLVPSTLGPGANARIHTPKAVAYHEQPHYCRSMLGHSLGLMESRISLCHIVFSDHFYLKYLAARLASYSNVWWSMANEWDFCACKAKGVATGASPIWDDLFKTLSAEDPYDRQMSIHNGAHLYNHSQPWITHVSLQGHEGVRKSCRRLSSFCRLFPPFVAFCFWVLLSWCS